MARQQFEHVAEQEMLVDIDEAPMTAESGLDAQFGEGVGDDDGRRLHAVGDGSGVVAAVAKQQFVSDQLLLAIENGLAPEKNPVSGGIAHDASLKR